MCGRIIMLLLRQSRSGLLLIVMLLTLPGDGAVPQWVRELGIQAHQAISLTHHEDNHGDTQLTVGPTTLSIRRGTVLVRVPPSALIVRNTSAELALVVARHMATARRCEKGSEEEATCSDPLIRYTSDVRRRPSLRSLPALRLSVRVAEACLAPHLYRLFMTAQHELADLLEAARRSPAPLRASRRDLELAWAAVRTRAITIPTTKNFTTNSVALVPFIDMANHNGTMPTAKFQYQQRKRADDGFDLDVLLVTKRDMPPTGGYVTVSYGNIRHPIDAVDTYGFLTDNLAEDAAALGSRIAAAFPTIPIQIRFPNDDEYFRPRGCNNDSVVTFDATTGRPSDAVLPCVSLAQLQSLGGAQAVIATQAYAQSRMTKLERRQLAKAAWSRLANMVQEMRNAEYLLPAEKRAACSALAIGAPKGMVDVLTLTTAATMFMRDAYGKLYDYCLTRVDALRAATEATRSQKIEEL